jgi:uncharacterized protein YhaN
VRLHKIEVENFGIFRGSGVGFGDGRFHLVCGPNEAGKSTLLQLIRELLFGFVVRNPYAFPEHDGEMAATLSAEMRDGSRIRFRRRKGNRNTVTGEVDGTGRTFDEAGLVRLLGNANAELYQNVFGFSLAELAQGEQSLKHARLEEALYGGGLGGLANFQQTLAAIQAEHQSLFMASRRAQRPQINRLLADIHDGATKLGQAMVKPRDYKEMCQRRDECVEAAETLNKRREECFRRQAHIERLIQALPLWQRLGQAGEELASLDVPATFPLAAAEEFRQFRQQLQQVSEEITAADNELAETEADLTRIHLAPELIAEEAATKKLVQQLAQVASCRRDIPLRQHEADTTRSEILATLNELHPGWDLSHLEQFRTSLAQRDRVDRMADESAALEKQAHALSLQHAEKQTKLAKDLQILERLKTVPAVPHLEKLIQRAGQYRADCEQVEQTETQLATLDGQSAQLRRQMAGPFGIAAERVELLPVPLLPAVQEFGRDFPAVIDALRQAAKDHEQAKRDLARSKDELKQFDTTRHVPDRDALAAQRSHRDDGWRLVRQTYVEGQHLDSQIEAWLGQGATSLPDQYEQEVAKADRLADDRQEKAELVARREQIAAEVARHENRLTAAKEELDKCQAARDRLDQAWQDLWSACRLSPKSPDVMIEWLRLQAQLAEKLQNRLGLDSRLQQIQRRASAFEESLRAALGKEAEADELLALARERTDQARDAALQIARLDRDLPAQQEELQQLGCDQEEIARQQETWSGRWQDVLSEFGFPVEWDVRLAVKMLSELANARVTYQSVGTTEKRIREMRVTVTEFERQVAELCGSLGNDLQTLPAEDAVSQFNDRLTDAKQAAKQQTTLLAQRQRTAQRLNAKRTQRDRLVSRLGELRGAAGVASDDEFERMAISAARRKVLSDEIDRLRRDIGRIAANEQSSPFEAELLEADVDSLALASQQGKEELASVEKAYTQAVEQAALAKKHVEDLEGQHGTNELAQKLESDRAELRDAVERWAPLVLAESMLTEAIARFERDNQPAMLRDVGQLFSKLTRGRYVGLRRKLDTQGTLVLAEANGKSKEPNQLSTGTREQLYLAIRLAYVRHYCRENEPLPLVMDDVLVNFDDERAEAALDLLIDLAQDIQVIFLTCHQSTMQRIQSRLPDLQVTQLGQQFPETPQL